MSDLISSLRRYGHVEAANAIEELLLALTTAREMLLERSHGNPARSAAHNARVVIESALAKFEVSA